MAQDRSSVVIIGGGIMGGDIAIIFAANGWDVHVMSPSAKTREALPPRIEAGLKKLGAGAAKAGRVKAYPKLADIDWAGVNMVVEAATEDLALKQRLFAEVEALAGADVPIASNTSNFQIGEIGKTLKHRSRVLGLHFFMPAHLVPLVEVVSSDATDPSVAESMMDLMKRLGKAPIWVKKDVPGFVGNRIQHAMMREALYLIQDGIVSPEGVDTAVRYGFGFRFIACGPIMQKEMSGWDTNFYVASALYPHLYKNDGPPPIIKELMDKNRLGMKTKRGFWEWDDEKIAKEKARIEKALQSGMNILKDDTK
ncbi:MAG TPA: 3-hydroxyacyl-CoA dehydrogenase NAD-binding domain-containing protein [Burkholderiales bacterium]|jgi:3-hydroxybutyryl-CoA dehydrogenase|nr:3-hydroxyacyl-CoA dehydrogenase NAD-binding domain-containing protein [Burkholderiales bacterium]